MFKQINISSSTMTEVQLDKKAKEIQKEKIQDKYKHFDFTRLEKEQSELIQSLSTFTYQSSFINLLQKQFGNTSIKQRYIDSNKMYLDSNNMAILNEETLKYKANSLSASMAITSTMTIGALIYGICVLPARKSPVRYTFAGFVAGTILSYGFWRFQFYCYNDKVNLIFRKIIKDQYAQMKNNKK